MGRTAPFIVIETDIFSKGIPAQSRHREGWKKLDEIAHAGINGDQWLWRKQRLPSKRIFMSSTLSMATPAMPTSPTTRGWSES